jgi:hypothetical protein
MKRTLFVTTVLFLIAAGGPTLAHAQLKIGPHVGLNTNGTDLFIGANLQFGIPAGEYALIGNPGFDYYLNGPIDSRINLDVLFAFPLTSLDAYAGGGLNLENDNGDDDIGLNLKAGFSLNNEDMPYKPFLELTQTVGSGSDFSIRGGVFFTLSGND